MKFHQPLHQAQTDAQAALRAVQRTFCLREHIEHAGQQLGRNADAGVKHPQHRVAALGRHGHGDPATVVGIFGSVGQQVDHHLFQPGGIPVDPHWGFRACHSQRVAALGDQGLGAFHRARDDAAQRNALLTQLDPAGGDAGDFQQVVNQVVELPHLPLNHIACLHLHRVVVLVQPQQAHGVGNRRQRVAQFVAQHGQKFVLAPVEVGQHGGLRLCFLLQTTALSHVIKTGYYPLHLPLVIPQRHHVHHQRQPESVGPFQHHFHVAGTGRLILEQLLHRFIGMANQRPVWPVNFELGMKLFVSLAGLGRCAPNFDRAQIEVLDHPGAVAGVHCDRSVVEQRSEALFAFAQGFAGIDALCDVGEQQRHLLAARCAARERVHIEPALNLLGFSDKTQCLAGQGYVAVGVEPKLLQVRQYFAHPLAGYPLHTRLRREGRVGRDEGVVDRLLVRIEDHLDDAIALVHRVEQVPVAVFRLAQRLFGLLLKRDVARRAKPLKDAALLVKNRHRL